MIRILTRRIVGQFPRVKSSYNPSLRNLSGPRHFLCAHIHTNLHLHPTPTLHHIIIALMPSTNKFRFNNYCVCGNQDCFLVQTQFCQLVSPPTTGDDDKQPPTPTDVWCHPRPLSIKFNPTESNYRSWLFILCICHHIPRFKVVFLAFVSEFFQDNPLPMTSRTTTRDWYINWIHFPRGLLENRSTHKILQNQTLMSPAVAKRLSRHDDNKSRMLEHVNTVSFLDKFGRC